jgi:diguanylate cyclase
MAAGQADEHERTMAFAEIALGQIKALRQPASPRNYEIWYAYATGYQPSLDQRINETLKQNDTLSEADLEPIDETFLSPRRLSERIDNVGSQVRGEIEQVMAIDTAFVAQNFAVCVAENKNVLGKKFLPR